MKFQNIIHQNSAKNIQNRIDGKNIIAIASGKGGVGKTFIAVSLAHAFALKGLKVLLVDGDLGLSNVDIQLGLTPANDLAGVFAYNRPINTAVIHDENTNLDILAGQCGSQTLSGLDEARLQLLCDDLRILANHYDKVIIDLGTGIQKAVTMLAAIAGEILIITTDSPTALADAYAFINIMHTKKTDLTLKVIVNMANTIKEGERTYHTLFKACQSFLNIEPALVGIIHQDTAVREAVCSQIPLLNMETKTQAGQDILEIQNNLLNEKSS